jgi:hypothetical protein
LRCGRKSLARGFNVHVVILDVMGLIEVTSIVRCGQDVASTGQKIKQRLILAHDPEKCAAVFRKDHAPTKP